MMLKQCSLEVAEMVVTVVWALWNNRNEIWNGDRRKSAAAIIQWCYNYIDEYQVANPIKQLQQAYLGSIIL